MPHIILKACAVALFLGLVSSPSYSKLKAIDLPLEEDPEISERYDFSNDNSVSFFELYFSDEPGDPVDYEEFYSIARMAFLFGFYETALEYWQPLANVGYNKAQASLGWMYHSGKGVKQNYKKAFKWYVKAANQNHAIAQNNLGVLYEKGWGVKRNYRNAVKWYREAAEWGYSYGQYNYGKMLREGKGVRKNKKQADYWLDLASIQGVKQANTLLGRKAAPALSHDPGNSAATALKKEVWIMLKNPRYFTLQIMQADSKKELEDFINKTSLQGQFAYYTVNKDKKQIYKLIYGVFPSFTSAEKKKVALPRLVLKNKPWIRKYKNIQDEIKDKLKKEDTAKKPAAPSKPSKKPKHEIPSFGKSMGPPIR